MTNSCHNNFFLVLCRTRLKFDKYIKKEKIKGKYVIDIRKMMDEEGITPEELPSSTYFKILIIKKFNLAKEKKRDIYYIPDFTVLNEVGKLFNIKELLTNTHNFNLLYFYDDINEPNYCTEILNKIEQFENSQILKDY